MRTPKGGEFWSTIYLKERILDDVYKPHTIEEVNALVEEELMAPEIASRLEIGFCYGIWWYNRRRIIHKQVPEKGPGPRRYRRTTKTEDKPRSEWIAVPVLDAGIPREWVDAARHIVLSHRQTSKRRRRFWELSGGSLVVIWVRTCHDVGHDRSRRTLLELLPLSQPGRRRCAKLSAEEDTSR